MKRKINRKQFVHLDMSNLPSSPEIFIAQPKRAKKSITLERVYLCVAS